MGEQSLCPDLHAVLLEQLGEVADEDRRVRRGHGVGEDHLGLVGFGLRLELGTLGPLILEVGGEADDEVGIGECGFGGLGGEVAAALADRGEDFVEYPRLEGDGAW